MLGANFLGSIYLGQNHTLVTVEVTQTVSAKARISRTPLHTITAKARIEQPVIIGGLNAKANIKATQTQTISAKGRIGVAESYTIESKARIEVPRVKSVSAKGQIHMFVELFRGTEFKDESETTANWDTTTERVYLPEA